MNKCQPRTWLQSPIGQYYLTSGTFSNFLGLSFLTCKRGTRRKELGAQDSSEFALVETLLSSSSASLPVASLCLLALTSSRLPPQGDPPRGWWGWEDRWGAEDRHLESTCFLGVQGPQPTTTSAARSFVEEGGQSPQGKGWGWEWGGENA